MAITFAVANAKGGVGKTTTTFNLGVALVLEGHRVLLIDNDPQKANLTLALGQSSQNLRNTLSTLYCTALDSPDELSGYAARAIIHGEEVDLLPANKKLSGIATRLSIEKGVHHIGDDSIDPELVLRAIVRTISENYDYVLIDCGPKLDMLMTNALAAADQVIIPVQAHYFSFEGVTDVMETVRYIRKEYNPDLTLSGLLLTMYQGRTNLCPQVKEAVKEQFGAEFRVFSEPVDYSIKVAEHPAYGESMFRVKPNHPATRAYAAMAKEVLMDA